MSKMKQIVSDLQEYEEALHSYGHADGLVQVLKRSLLGYNMQEVNDLVRGIDLEFDTLVFNNQTEGRF